MLEDEATRIDPQSSDFWVLAAALKRFVDGEGQGSLPLEARPLRAHAMAHPSQCASCHDDGQQPSNGRHCCQMSERMLLEHY